MRQVFITFFIFTQEQEVRNLLYSTEITIFIGKGSGRPPLPFKEKLKYGLLTIYFLASKCLQTDLTNIFTLTMDQLIAH